MVDLTQQPYQPINFDGNVRRMNHQATIGILLLNLGTPDAPTTRAVRRYLREFLWDPYVIDLPPIPRWLLLHLSVLPFRSHRSARLYQKIWSHEGSPLLVYQKKLKNCLSEVLQDHYTVVLGMRYGKPSIESAIATLKKQRCYRLVVLPLFPQYASAATRSAVEKALTIIRRDWNPSDVIVCQDFYADAGYIDSFSTVIQENLGNQKIDHFVFSYHGLPERQLKKYCIANDCDRVTQCLSVGVHNRYCYRAQCFATSALLATTLSLSTDRYSVSFQSRLGRIPWIKPYTDLLLPDLIQRGIKNIAVVCPSFVSDCLETLEEIGIRAREQWQSLGGDNFQLIPCLNDHPTWINALLRMIKKLEKSFIEDEK